MKKSVLTVLGFLFVGIFLATIARADGLKEGKWSMTMVTKMENLPPQVAALMGQGVTVTVSQCITQQNPVPQRSKNPQDCQETHDINGGTVHFHQTCDMHNVQIDSTGTMTYSGENMSGHIDTHQVAGGRTMDSTIDITGQYEGPC